MKQLNNDNAEGFNKQDPKNKIFCAYLQGNLPADLSDKNKVLKSSQEIVDDLADMIEVNINEVAEILANAGYIVVTGDDHLPRWAMLPGK